MCGVSVGERLNGDYGLSESDGANTYLSTQPVDIRLEVSPLDAVLGMGPSHMVSRVRPWGSYRSHQNLVSEAKSLPLRVFSLLHYAIR